MDTILVITNTNFRAQGNLMEKEAAVSVQTKTLTMPNTKAAFQLWTPEIAQDHFSSKHHLGICNTYSS